MGMYGYFCVFLYIFAIFQIFFMDSVRDKSGVGAMFDSIAWRYDFLNHFLSLGIDRLWRRRAVGCFSPKRDGVYLDVAAGTGDMCVELVRDLHPARVIGIDISEGMLGVGREKIKSLGLEGCVDLRYGNCERLDFGEDLFDGATIGFGIRNFQNPQKGLSEIYRVLKGGGELVVLEFSRPRMWLVRFFFDFYFCHILPLIGRFFSKHRSAYSYLPESVMGFAYGEDFANWMRGVGFTDVSYFSLMFGVATVYRGVKGI